MSFNNNTHKDELNHNTRKDSINEVVEYVPLRLHEGWEILNVKPFTVRRIKDKFEPKISKSNSGYKQLRLGKETCNLHRLIAEQFVKNPKHFKYCDHYDGDRENNSISNIRWLSQSNNLLNRKEFNKEFTDEDLFELPDDEEIIDVRDYGSYEFEFYTFLPSRNAFYFFTGIIYQKLHICHNKRNNSVYVSALDTKNRRVKLYYNKFKKLYNLI
ncbi:hypothetical protein FACS189472_09770 [Alphaproteobacteria bacterium]|nr:hypothetical protein FACS189472_09770 [Alphaproteobacteria bacterium]